MKGGIIFSWGELRLKFVMQVLVFEFSLKTSQELNLWVQKKEIALWEAVYVH